PPRPPPPHPAPADHRAFAGPGFGPVLRCSAYAARAVPAAAAQRAGRRSRCRPGRSGRGRAGSCAGDAGAGQDDQVAGHPAQLPPTPESLSAMFGMSALGLALLDLLGNDTEDNLGRAPTTIG